MQTCIPKTNIPAPVDEAPLTFEWVDPLDLEAQRQTLAFVHDYMDSKLNRDGALRLRQDEQYKQAFAWGNVVRGRRGQQTVFCAMAYRYADARETYVELGAVLNTDRERGLMEPIVRAMIARTFQAWPDATVFAVAKPQTASAHVLSKVGMRSVNPSATLRLTRSEAGVPFCNDKKVFSMKLKPEACVSH